MFWLIGASLIWAFSFGLIKGMTSHVDPFVLSALRMVFAAVLALLFFRPNIVSRGIAARFLIIGFIQLGVMYAPYTLSFKYLKAYEVALFTMTSPLYVVFIYQLRSRSFSISTLFAAALAVVGGSIVAWKNLETESLLVGVALVQLSNLLFAFGQVLLVEWSKDLKISFLRTAPFYFAGALLGSVLCLVLSGHGPMVFTQQFSSRDWAVFAWLGVISSGAGFLMWNYGALRVTLAELAVALDFKLPIAVVVSILFFSEQADLMRVVAGGTVLFLAERVARRTSAPTPKPRTERNAV